MTTIQSEAEISRTNCSVRWSNCHCGSSSPSYQSAGPDGLTHDKPGDPAKLTDVVGEHVVAMRYRRRRNQKVMGADDLARRGEGSPHPRMDAGLGQPEGEDGDSSEQSYHKALPT